MASLPRAASLKNVADMAGVSAMTVSRALRGARGLTEATRQRVLQVAAKLGYHPDPHVSRLMHRIRKYRKRRVAAVIAVVRDEIPDDDLRDPAYHFVPVDYIRRRAEQHGYLVEEFFPGRNAMTPARLVKVLRARGIEGIIVSPQSSRLIGPQLEYEHFAAVTFGYGLPAPQLHRASANVTQGMQDACERLTLRGYRRIGIAITEWIDARSDHTYSGAMLNFQRRVPVRQRVPLLLFPENRLAGESGIFRRWYRKHRPDVVISFERYVPDWLTGPLGLRIPDDVGLVLHDHLKEFTGLAGIDHQRAEIAAAAVDLLVTQLMQNERGVPAVARQVLTSTAWVEGESVRAPPPDNPFRHLHSQPDGTVAPQAPRI